MSVERSKPNLVETVLYFCLVKTVGESGTRIMGRTGEMELTKNINHPKNGHVNRSHGSGFTVAFEREFFPRNSFH